jgi:hypothetical protein
MDIKKIANKIILLGIILGTPSIGVEIKKLSLIHISSPRD